MEKPINNFLPQKCNLQSPPPSFSELGSQIDDVKPNDHNNDVDNNNAAILPSQSSPRFTTTDLSQRKPTMKLKSMRNSIKNKQNDFKTATDNEKVAIISRKTEENSKNSLRKSILQSDSKCELFCFLLKRLFVPLLLISLSIVFLILTQRYIEDYCFYPELCHCSNIGVYLYTFIREFLQFDCIILAWSYFVGAYLTNNFYNSQCSKYLFFVLEFVILFAFFFIFFNRRNDEFLADFRIWRSIVVSIIGASYIILFSLLKRKCSKGLFQKLVRIGIFTAFYFIHGLYLKNTFSLYLYQELLKRYEATMAKNVFKLILLVYYVFYNLIAKSMIFGFYNEYSDNPGCFPIELIVSGTKFITIDVLSVQIMNALTIPLNDGFAWIAVAYYIFSMVNNYIGWDISGMLLRVVSRVFGRKKLKTKEKKNERKDRWDEIRRGCLLESNIIIFTRILIFYFFQSFYYFTKYSAIFKDCSLYSIEYGFVLEWPNIILILSVHTGIVGLILFFMVKKKKILLELVVEDVGILLRIVFLFIFYSQIDLCIQIYMFLGVLK